MSAVEGSVRTIRFVLIICLVSGLIRGAAAQEGTCSEIACGDVDLDGSRNLGDVVALLNYLYGEPLPCDSNCAEFDDKAGITVGDLSVLMDYTIWCEYQFIACGASSAYAYPASTVDTLYVPARSYIPEDVQRVELELRVYFGAGPYPGCYPSIYLPVIGTAAGSNDCFVLDSIVPPNSPARAVTGDTALSIAIRGQGWPTGMTRELVGTLIYKRVNPGIGRIRPEVPESFYGRRMGIAYHPEGTLDWDIHQPVIFEEAACCDGLRGNVSNDPGDIDDISDLTTLVSHLFVTFAPLPCFDEADVNADGSVDISDLTALVNCLFVTFQPCGAPCPTW